jgi:hypothetical protein
MSVSLLAFPTPGGGFSKSLFMFSGVKGYSYNLISPTTGNTSSSGHFGKFLTNLDSSAGNAKGTSLYLIVARQHVLDDKAIRLAEVEEQNELLQS